MAFNMFENALDNDIIRSPKEQYRDLEQAFICQQWDNTTAVECIMEQDYNSEIGFDNFKFHKTHAWLNTIVGMTTTGSKESWEFVQLLFEDLDHLLLEGRYYQFHNNYWLAYNDDRISSVVSHLSVRRCNNWLKIVDNMNGSVYKIPCVVDYDMTASSSRVANSIITPNNHAVIKVQENNITARLFKTNTRFILSGRPFKIYGYQNATEQFPNSEKSSCMIEMDLFLDEIWDEDNLEEGLAYNGTYDYTVKINSADMILTKDSIGTLSADVSLNGEEVERPIVWISSNDRVVKIDENGSYTAIGNEGTSATITCMLDGNSDVVDSITISIESQEDIQAEIVVDPVFEKIREHETINFKVEGFYGGVMYTPSGVELIAPENAPINIVQEDNNFQITCNKRTKQPITLSFKINNDEPEFEAVKDIQIQLVNMMG